METPQEAVQSEPSEEIEPESTQDESSDGWAEAKEVFDEPIQEVEQEEPQPVDSKSHIEQEKPGEPNLETLRIPRKYKDTVKEYTEQVKAHVERQNQEAVKSLEENVGQHQEAIKDVVTALKSVLTSDNPIESLQQLAAQYGHLVGLDSSQVNLPQQSQQQEQKTKEQAIAVDQIVDKYAQQMMTTQDASEFVNLLKSQNMEIAQAVENKMMSTVSGLLRAYHDKYIEPDKKTLNEFKTQREADAQKQAFETTRGNWNSAVDAIKGKHKDFGNYEKQVVELLTKDPDFNELRLKLNQNPSDIDGRKRLIERVYKFAAMEAKANQKTLPRPKLNGMMPNSKHITTTKAGGSDWDEIRNDPELGWE